MSLRLKLTLSLVAMVSLLLIVGLTSYRINHEIRKNVAELRSNGGLDLRMVDFDAVGLEFEGFWDPAGSFIVSDVEVLPGRRHPKLRGAIQHIQAEPPSITLFGVQIRVTGGTKFEGAGSQRVRFEDLRPGQRVEVSCKNRDGGWIARKIKTANVKSRDKIKGTVTSAELDGVAPETLEIHGLRVTLAAQGETGPDSALRRIELATRMTLALQECRTVAHELVGQTRARPERDDEFDRDRVGDRDRNPGAGSSAEERLVRAQRDFDHYLKEAQGGESGSAQPLSAGTAARWLQPLAERGSRFRQRVHTLQLLARADPARAQIFLINVFDPFLEDDLLQPVYAYLSEAEEALADQLRAIASRTETTTRVALATSVVAVLLALGLGVPVWRSINRPIRALHAAAVRLGQGHLDTRVELESRDELGILAEAFNKMASQLATTTVSVGNLESIFDSMAGALILFDPEVRITRVNRAALDLLGYQRSDLIGQSFGFICPASGGSSDRPIAEASRGGAASIEEKLFVRADGSEVPVSFSGAELRSGDGPLLGYVCVAQDLTERKQIEERIRGSLAEKELLLREVHHRVKNNMQVISSLLAMQSSTSSDPEVLEKFEESQNRIRSMGFIHEQLYQSSNLSEIDFRAYLEELTTHLLQSFGRPGVVDIVLEAEPVALEIDQAISCGLIVNELVTNAFKHAFPDDGSGEIRISLSRQGSGQLELVVADNGRGFGAAPQPGRAQSLGMSLVATLAKQLRGELRIGGEGGTEVWVVFPHSDPARAGTAATDRGTT